MKFLNMKINFTLIKIDNLNSNLSFQNKYYSLKKIKFKYLMFEYDININKQFN